MVMRITESMKFSTSVASLNKVQGRYQEVLEKMASQKRINKISDDPLGMTRLLNYRQVQASIDQYQKNNDAANGWLRMTETKLSGANDLLIKAKELALGQGTATATAESRLTTAEAVKQLKEEMLSLANSKYGDRYLFSGASSEVAPFSAQFREARIDAPLAASNNQFDGTVAAQGSYTGSLNETQVVKIVQGGSLAEATYRVSTDGGKTWGDEQTDLDMGTVNLPDGLSLTLDDAGVNRLAAGDMFTLRAYAPGYYSGNGDVLTIDIGRDASIAYNITGEAVFAGGSEGVDVFKVLDDLQAALKNNDQQGILAQVDKLTEVSGQINAAWSKVGNTMNRLTLAKGNLEDLKLQVAELTSNTEDADITELATAQAMLEITLQASYITASKIGSNTILNFIK